jgi:uncharacterized protein YqjF (DUF2071 family)
MSEPVPVRPALMLQQWRLLTFLHWRYPAPVVQSLLPDGLTVQTFDGTAWIGLVPFVMHGVRAPGVPALPWLSRFPETNVRTYVEGPDGRVGIWFFSLDAARLAPVLAGRTGYGLPYYWSSMRVTVSGPELAYRCVRRWPGPAGARCDAVVTAGPAYADDELGTLDHFLTARFRLYSVHSGRLVAADADHPPWPLHRGELRSLDQTVLQTAGLPAPQGDPLVHTSPGVKVRIGMWHPVG